MYETVLRPFIFRRDPELMHLQAVRMLGYLSKFPWLCKCMSSINQKPLAKPIELWGLKFPNAIGLAAGFDKNAECWQAAGALGFGFAEIGTITPQPQLGNEQPRLFRYKDQEAVINRMGFNNQGAEAVAKRLHTVKKKPVPLGINIGKGKATTLEAAHTDYVACFKQLAPYADYFAVNISSPNTPGLRKLQAKEQLHTLFEALNHANKERIELENKPRIPLVIKIAPDLTFSELDGVLEAIYTFKMDGIIATNTTIWRPSSIFQEQGGLSGKPLHSKALDSVRYIHKATSGTLPIVGAGGIFDAAACGRMMDAGASLVQLYTGLIYKGPFLPAQLAQSIRWRYKEWI